MYETICIVSKKTEEGSGYVSHGDTDPACNHLKAFDFILILHLIKEIRGNTNILSQALQQQSHDVVNVMHLICTIKILIQELKEND